VLRGVAFRSSRAEPFAEDFLRRALSCLLAGDVSGVRSAYVETIHALRHRMLSTHAVSSRIRLTKSREEYMETRETRRELPYEALLASGRTTWSTGERVRVYRTRSGEGAIVRDPDESDQPGGPDELRDYDTEHYVRTLRDLYAARLARAFAPGDFATVFAEPDQLLLFAAPLDAIRTVLSSNTPGDAPGEDLPPE